MLMQMFGAGIVFLVIAIVAALFGFGGVSEDSLAAKLCAIFFLLAAAAAFGWGWMNRSRKVVRPAPRSAGASRSPAGDGIRRRGLEWEAP